MCASQTHQVKKPSLLLRAHPLTMIALGAAAALTAGLFLLTIGLRLAYQDRAFPGVSFAGQSLTGMEKSEIRSLLQGEFSFPDSGLVVLRYEGQTWVATPQEIGFQVDTETMTTQALAIARQNGVLQRLVDQWKIWLLGESIAPIAVFDQTTASAYLQEIASDIDQPLVEANLIIEGVDITMHPGQVGRRLDIPSTLEALQEPLSKLQDADLDLPIILSPPLVLDASAQVKRAEAILREPLVLTAEEDETWRYEPQALASMLRFSQVETSHGTTYEVVLDFHALAAVLNPLVSELQREPQNARFIFNDETRELDLLQSAVDGRSLDIAGTIDAIHESLEDGDHTVPLVFSVTSPDVSDDATAAQLGIDEQVVVVSSYFSGSDDARVQNIATAAGAFHGLLVPPGDSLSMAEILGDISLDQGYAEALIIFGDRTIKGVGGGVCQVSTTLFRAAFFGGYPILERHPHAYRVGYYEIGSTSPGPGLDATVFVPVVDFKFTNDRDSWLLLETYIYGSQLVWKFYSASEGRSLEWDSHLSNEIEAPKPLYRENPDLPEGEIEQIDWEADGLDVLITRSVFRDGDLFFEDTFETHYLPWRAIYAYGPGTKLPKDALTEEDENE